MIVTLLAFIVVLGIVITVHEFGHFSMAKLLKIRVITFSLGFGPRLFGFTRGGTEYRVSALPLGGYVKMAGEAFDEDRQGAPDEFLSHPKWHRLLVALAGPIMNILLAILIVAISYIQGVQVFPRYLKEPAVVGPVTPDSVAQRAGLQSKDRIVAVNGNRVNTWQDMEIALATTPRDSLAVTVDRDGRRLDLHLKAPQGETTDTEALGFRTMLPRTIVHDLGENSPAQAAELQPGDEILSVRAENGREGKSYDEILNIIAASKGIPLEFEIRRAATAPDTEMNWDELVSELSRTGTVHRKIVTPEEKTFASEDRKEYRRVIIGFNPVFPADYKHYGLFGSIGQSVRHNYDVAAMTFTIIGRIFTGSASVRTLSGPIEIASVAGSAARTRSARLFFGFIGLLSLNLGIFNLLPIPILDGGVIALLLVEGLIGRDLSRGIKEKIVQVGFVFLILLMGFVVFNDLTKIPIFHNIFR
jgi:regulator of sigma E protease